MSVGPLKVLCVCAVVAATSCTEYGQVDPTVLGLAAGVAAVNNPNFDQDAFNRSAAQYYGETPPPRTTVLAPTPVRVAQSPPLTADGQDITPATRKGLRPFTVSQRDIQICVWDYQCEDGDRVTVKMEQLRGGGGFTANQTLVSFPLRNWKLSNEPRCINAVVPDSGLRIVLVAENGTGFEGQCSHADANTGAMSVSGGGGRDTWALNGGSGTSTSIRFQQ